MTLLKEFHAGQSICESSVLRESLSSKSPTDTPTDFNALETKSCETGYFSSLIHFEEGFNNNLDIQIEESTIQSMLKLQNYPW